jgi:U3 small nucleolar RNA-associated protein MPP10
MPHATHDVADTTGTMDSGEQLLKGLSTSIQSFLQPPSALHSDSVAYLKTVLDPLATDVATAQALRRDENRRKRKRHDDERDQVLQLRQVYTVGLGVKQVWEQAKRILDATCAEVEREIAAQEARQQILVAESSAVETLGIGSDSASDVPSGDSERSELEPPFSENSESSDMGNPLAEDLSQDDEDEDEDIERDFDASDIDSPAGAETYTADPNGLNDGFFSIDDFNKQTQFLEQQDALGEDDDPSDEDDIDWEADPLTMPFHTPKGGVNGPEKNADDPSGKSDEPSEDESDDGPTFGDADLNADDSDEAMLDPDDDVEDDLAGLSNTNEIRYADFFAPPPKKQSKTKRMRALPKTQPTRQQQAEDDESENDVQRAIADVRRDLLESDEEMSDIESGSDVEAGRQATKNMSTHEKQRAAIAAEIRRLEAANVAKRDWTLSGEARATDRPLNSLIEEDLEFERVGKPVPVITAEVSEDIEQLIKRRILAREFDEVVRRRPDATTGAGDARRGRVDLDDAKPQSGLAEVYEQEHLKATDPGYVDKRSAATKKQHEEISRLWKEVSSQLDLLSNLHFKPKRTEIEIKAVEDKPTISMEDARPVGMGVNAGESMLAPQEVYRVGEQKGKKDVVVHKGGASTSREEMTREEKLRRRRREKERTKKAQTNNAGPGPVGQNSKSSKKSKARDTDQKKSDILSELRKGNVKVVGKKGDLQGLDGKKVGGRAEAGVLAGGSLKL